MKYLRSEARPAAFIVVVALAAATHWVVAVQVVERLAVAPALANLLGWLGALLVSYAGHWRWTFGDRRAPALRAASHFFILSAGAFALNALAYGVLLHYRALRYDIGLALVLLVVAFATYFANRRWAFRDD